MFPPAAGSACAPIPSGLARQQLNRRRALKAVAQLREEASTEIERLIAFLDQTDIYVRTELELDGDEGVSA